MVWWGCAVGLRSGFSVSDAVSLVNACASSTSCQLKRKTRNQEGNSMAQSRDERGIAGSL